MISQSVQIEITKIRLNTTIGHSDLSSCSAAWIFVFAYVSFLVASFWSVKFIAKLKYYCELIRVHPNWITKLSKYDCKLCGENDMVRRTCEFAVIFSLHQKWLQLHIDPFKLAVIVALKSMHLFWDQ